MVAGAKDGDGAEDVVLVRDCAERDLSRNSTIDYGGMRTQFKLSSIHHMSSYLGVLNGLIPRLYLRGYSFVQGNY